MTNHINGIAAAKPMRMDILVDQTPVSPDKHPGPLLRFIFKRITKTDGLGRIRTGDLCHFQASFSKLELSLSFFTADCQLVKEVQSRDDEESKGDRCTSSEEDRGGSRRQTDSKNGLFLERAAEETNSERTLTIPIHELSYDDFATFVNIQRDSATVSLSDTILAKE